MRILSIESSCDETSAAVIRDGMYVESNVISSSRADFAALAGVIPEQAARQQSACIIPVVERAITVANTRLHDIDALAVTAFPGLLGSLLVGTSTARALAATFQKPLIPVHHTLGHIYSTWLEGGNVLNGAVSELLPEFPILSLSVSGGHTELWLLESHASRVLLGATLDDAAGEAFDKGANMLGLPYPGGPAIAAAAKQGEKTSFSFPRPRTNNDETNIAWSFSGLKTALKYTIADVRKKEESDCLSDTVLSDLSASYQEAICMHLLDGVRNALTCNPTVRELHIVGGVSANMRLRAVVQAFLSEHHPKILLRVPAALQYCTDNGAMIGAAAYFTHTNTQTLWRTAATFHSPINPRSQAGWM